MLLIAGANPPLPRSGRKIRGEARDVKVSSRKPMLFYCRKTAGWQSAFNDIARTKSQVLVSLVAGLKIAQLVAQLKPVSSGYANTPYNEGVYNQHWKMPGKGYQRLATGSALSEVYHIRNIWMPSSER